MEKGKGKWIRIINIIKHIRMCLFGLLPEIKKGGETSKSKILLILKTVIYRDGQHT